MLFVLKQAFGLVRFSYNKWLSTQASLQRLANIGVSFFKK